VVHSISTQKNGFFGLQNFVVPIWHREKKNSSILNIMISQTIKNECVGFGGYVKEEEEELQVQVGPA
jgi:hypothetical protein